MLGTLLYLSLTRASDPVTLTASESVWVYAHASDPSGDQFLRIWGVGGSATPEGKDGGDDWSYGYLKWDLRALPSTPPKTATLTLYNVNPAGFGDAAGAARVPLQARSLVGSFVGKDWEYSKSYNIRPGLAATVFGSGAPAPWGDKKDPIQITIDLMKGPGKFADYLSAAKKSDDHALFLALTSAIDPNTEEGGGAKGGVYKIYSASAATDAHYRPVLTLEF